MTFWEFRVAIANLIITFTRKYIVPSGCNYKYALRLQVLNKVNYLSLKNAPLFDGEKVLGE